MPTNKQASCSEMRVALLLAVLLHGALLMLAGKAAANRATPIYTSTGMSVQLLDINPLPVIPIKTAAPLPSPARRTSRQFAAKSSPPLAPRPARLASEHRAASPTMGALASAASRAVAEPALNLQLDLQALQPKSLIVRKNALPKPEQEAAPSAMRQALEKGIRPDCRRAYSAMGLLAVPMLMKDALSESGCQW